VFETAQIVENSLVSYDMRVELYKEARMIRFEYPQHALEYNNLIAFYVHTQQVHALRGKLFQKRI